MARMPIFELTFFGHNSTTSEQIGVKFEGRSPSRAAPETIIYQLVMINLSNDAYFSVLIFWATFDRKMGVATTPPPNGLGAPNRIKKLANCVNLLG